MHGIERFLQDFHNDFELLRVSYRFESLPIVSLSETLQDGQILIGFIWCKAVGFGCLLFFEVVFYSVKQAVSISPRYIFKTPLTLDTYYGRIYVLIALRMV